MFLRTLAFSFLTLLAASAALAQAPIPVAKVGYSADRIMETESGTFTGKVYSMPGRDRSETNMSGMSSVVILRRDLESGWMLMPAQKMYRTLDFSEASKQSGGAPNDISIVAVGPDTIDGIATTKYKMVMKDGSAGGFTWFTKDGIAVKMDMLSKNGSKTDRITMTLKNLQIGTQDPALFELPAGYNEMGGFPGMKGGLPGFGRKRATGN